MRQGVTLRVSGARACFSCAEFKTERSSYPVITPSAARGIFEAVYWRPRLRWVIDQIHVLKPIRFQSLTRNEIGDRISAIPYAMQSRAVTFKICRGTPPTAGSAVPPPFWSTSTT